MAPPKKLAHVVYMTRRYDEMLSWYQNVFEAKVQHQNPVITFLTWDDEHHRFALVNLDALDPDGVDPGVRSSVGVNHVAYTYASVGDLLGTYSRLKERGVMPYWRVHHGLTLSLYYSDPDGNRMEFQVDCFDTMEESNAFIRGEVMAANPIGIAFDPDDLLQRHLDGVPEAELLIQPTGPVAEIPREEGF